MTFNRLLVVLNNAYTLLRHTTSDPSADPVDSPVDSSDPPEASVCSDRPDRPLSTPSLSTHAVAQCSLALPNPNQPNNVNTNEGAHGSVGSAEVLVVPDARAPAVPAAAPVPSTTPSPTTHHVAPPLVRVSKVSVPGALGRTRHRLFLWFPYISLTNKPRHPRHPYHPDGSPSSLPRAGGTAEQPNDNHRDPDYPYNPNQGPLCSRKSGSRRSRLTPTFFMNLSLFPRTTITRLLSLPRRQILAASLS